MKHLMKLQYFASVLAIILLGGLNANIPAQGSDDITQTGMGEENASTKQANKFSIKVGGVLQSSLSKSWSTNVGVDYSSYGEFPTTLNIGLTHINMGDNRQNLIDVDLHQTITRFSEDLQVVAMVDHTDSSAFANFGIEKSTGISIGILDTFIEGDKSTLRGFLGLVRAKDRTIPGVISPLSGSSTYSYTAPQLFLSAKYLTQSGVSFDNDFRTRVSFEDTSYSFTVFDSSVSFPINKKISMELQLGATHYGSPPIPTKNDIDISSMVNIAYRL